MTEVSGYPEDCVYKGIAPVLVFHMMEILEERRGERLYFSSPISPLPSVHNLLLL